MNKDIKQDYKDSLNLPRTSFPMRAGLPQKEPEMLKKWQKLDIYKRIMDKNSGSEESFILHDGPPYANGHIHMGHVLNKLLKDIGVKYNAMKGKTSPYVPGWDCHGLPVEHALFKELNMTKDDIDQVEFRKKAFKYAMKFVEKQKKEFKRIGVFGDWDNPYLTLTKNYESDILYALADLYEKGYIYKGLKPVNWCKECETALAEAEVEYDNKTSPSIYCKFEAPQGPYDKKTYFVIWTTTPWTLLANVAVAVKPDFNYCAVDTGDEIWVMLEDLAKIILEQSGNTPGNTISVMTGEELVDTFAELKHPFIDRPSKLVTADYVTKEEGTGCVHTAPGHGQDDYATGLKYKLPVIMPVAKDGTFIEGTDDFSGMDVFEANKHIIEKLNKLNMLVLHKDIEHSYPHCWRCKTPIIFRATEQWFMSIDHNGLRDRMKEVISEDIKWIPDMGSERIGSMVESRPDWCLSRQRYWGVPIPAVKCSDCGAVYTDEKIIRNVASMTRESGADVWFEKDITGLLPQKLKCGSCGGDDFIKEEDILDVWFDSGVSHFAVLDERKDLSFPADIYLEGSDQHRGWFQAALITSMGMKNVPPYRKVLTHGFVVDGDGKKMSKSLGNVISPNDVMGKYGADILRLWVASSDYEGDIKLSEEILARISDGYRKIRNTFRFLLSNLYDFDPLRDAVDISEMNEIDRWMLSVLSKLISDIDRDYVNWQFHSIYRSICDFCVIEVSSFYMDVLKDVLYVEAPDSRIRRSSQTVIFHILTKLAKMLAPILSFTSEEIWSFVECEGKKDSVHLEEWPQLDTINIWRDTELEKKWDGIFAVRDLVMKTLEQERAKGVIGSSLEAKVILSMGDAEVQSLLLQVRDILPLIFRVSQVEVVDPPVRVEIIKADGEKCPRCWNYSGEIISDEKFNGLCKRCYNAMLERSQNA